MSTTDIPVDHDFVIRLTEAGMPTEQAEVLARQQANMVNTQLATKRDLKDLKRDLLLSIGSMLAFAIAANTLIEKVFGQ